MNKRKNYLVVFSFLVVLVGSLVFSGCETSRVGPEVPRPNPEAPAPQSVVVSSYVLDNTTGGGIPNAVVSLVKLDGTVLKTAVTNSSGMFSFDLTALNLTETSYNVSTTVAGYGYGFRVVTFDKTEGVAGVTPIVLTKIVNTVTITATPAAGGSASTPPTTDAKTNTPVTVTIPPNAVPTNTQVTVASVPVVSTPPPTQSAATQNIVASNNLSSPGVTTFSQPIKMTFTLPFQMTAGTQITLLLFDTATNKWLDSGLKAVVEAGGLTASVNVTKPGQYALLGDVKVTQTQSGKVIAGDGISVTKMEKVLGTKVEVIDIYPNTLTYTYDAPNDPNPFITVLNGSSLTIPNDSYLYGLIASRFGDNIADNIASRLTLTFTYNLPAQLKGSDGAPFNTRVGGGTTGTIQGPPQHTTESGDWVFRITMTTTLAEKIYNATQSGIFNVNITDPTYRTNYDTQWVWRLHNQGTAGLTGYNP